MPVFGSADPLKSNATAGLVKRFALVDPSMSSVYGRTGIALCIGKRGYGLSLMPNVDGSASVSEVHILQVALCL